MLTRLLLFLGLVCLVLWFVSRAALTGFAQPRGDASFPIPGEDLSRGLDVVDATLGGTASLPSAPAALPSAPPASQPPRVVTVTPLPIVAPTPGCFTYTVRAGDTPLNLARRFDTSLAAILADNQLSSTSRLRPGQRLALCVGPAAPPVAALPRYRVYRAQPGDTLPSLALRFGVPVYTLAQANNLPLSARLYAGQALRLPDDALVPVGAILLPSSADTAASAVQAAPAATPVPPASPAPRRVPVPQATETIHVEWPRQVTVGQAATIRLGFGRTAPLPDVAPLGSGRATPTPLPLFRVDRALAAAYDGVVVARLEAAGMETQLLSLDAQPLTWPDMGWAWRLSPSQPGRYQAQASLEVRWTPRASGQPIVHTVWQQPLDIEVVQPAAPGWLSNLFGIAGLVLSILGLTLDRLRPPPAQGTAGTAGPTPRRF